MMFNTDSPIGLLAIPFPLRRISVFSPSGSPTIVADKVGFAVDPPCAEVDTVRATFKFLPPARKWASRHIVISDDGTCVAQAIRLGTAVAVSDGSLKDGIGTAAFIIVNDMCGYEHPIVGAMPIPGTIKEGDSH